METRLCPLTFPTGKPEKCKPLACAWFLDEKCVIVRIEEVLKKLEQSPQR